MRSVRHSGWLKETGTVKLKHCKALCVYLHPILIDFGPYFVFLSDPLSTVIVSGYHTVVVGGLGRYSVQIPGQF